MSANKPKKVGFCFKCNCWMNAPEVHERVTGHHVGYYYRAKDIDGVVE